MSISQFEIQNPDGTTIFGDYQKSANQPQKSKFAIILHGFKGNHRWGFLPTLRDLFAATGYNAIAYTHSFSGYIPDSPKYDIDKFRRTTVTQQLKDLQKVIRSIKSDFETAPDITICGHSMGAAIALVYSALHPEDNISKLVMLAPVATFDRYYTERQKEQWRRDGFLEFYNPKVDQKMALDLSFLVDIEQNYEKYNPLKAAKTTKSRIFLAHGEQDLTSKICESEILYEQMNQSSVDFNRFSHCNHAFNWDINRNDSEPLKILCESLSLFLNRE